VNDVGRAERESPRGHIPVATAVLVVAAVMSPLVLSAIAGDDIPFGWVLGVPLGLGIVGAVLAQRCPSLGKKARSVWVVVSVLAALLTVPVVYTVATLFEAVGWTISGPPPWL
jgi:predicted membrane channel-forming protein YqfA (hemolysin III family)